MGQTYQLSGYLGATKTSGSHLTVLSVLAYDAADNYLGECACIREEETIPQWTRKSAALPANTLPSGTVTVRVKVAAKNVAGTGTSYFDGVQFEEGTAISDFVAPITYTVDPGALAAAMYDGSGRKVKWTYSDSGNPLTETVDPAKLDAQAQFSWVTDKHNLLDTFKDAEDVRSGSPGTKYQYDADGNLTLVTDALQNTTELDYSSLNDLTAFTDPKTYASNPTVPQVQFTYDGQRNATAAPDRQGNVSAVSVDLSNCPGCILGQTPALTRADNLLTNGAFERSASGTWPDGWTASGGVATWVTSPVYGGDRAIAVTPSDQPVTVRHSTNIAIDPDLVNKDPSYVLSLYVRTDNQELGAEAQGLLEFLSDSGTVLSTAYTNLFKRSDEWNRSVVVATAPQGATQVRVTLNANPAATAGNVYFDSVQLEQAPHISAFNLLDNPGFERGSSLPEYWQNSNQPFAWSSVAFAGTKSISLTNATATSGFEPTYFIRYESSHPVALTAFVKTNDLQNGSAYVKLKWYNAQFGYIGQTKATTRRSGSNDWTRQYVQIPPGGPDVADLLPGWSLSDIAYVKPSLVVEVETGSTVGTAYFDAVRLEQSQVATEYQYASQGQPLANNWVTQVTNPVGNYVNFEYNDSGFVTKVTPNEEADQAVVYTPDSLQRLQSVALPNGLTTAYSYTGNGLLGTLLHTWTDGTAQSATTSYGYNRQDQLSQVTDPLNRVTSYSYGADGNLASVTQPTGTVISFGYDTANRLSERSFAGTVYKFQYFDNGALKQASHGTEVWSYTYDLIHRLTATSNMVGDVVVGTVSYGYDRNSNLTSREASDGTSSWTNAFTYDERDRLLRVDDGGGNLEARFSYDEQGRLAKWVTADNRVYWVMEYDGAGRMVKQQNLKVDGTLLATYAYTYDDRGNRTVETVTTPAGTTTQNFSYDAVGQLTSDGAYAYAYTPRGNRKTRVSGGVTQYYCYDAADQLTYRGPNPCNGTTNFTYDANGNMTQNASGGAVWEYQYDGENRLIEVKQNGAVAATFTYDFLGRRQSKTVGDTMRIYHYDGLSNRVLYETDGSPNVVVWYTWAGDQLVSQTRGAATYYYEYSGHGDVVGLFDNLGNPVNTYAYDVWGKPDLAGTSETVENPYRYAGYRWDAETGLYYLNARYYDPDLGRFLTQDTFPGSAEQTLTMNRYLYGKNNPLSFIDPVGLWSMRQSWVLARGSFKLFSGAGGVATGIAVLGAAAMMVASPLLILGVAAVGVFLLSDGIMTAVEGIGDMAAAALDKPAPTMNAFDATARAVGGDAGVAALNGTRLVVSLGTNVSMLEKGAELAVMSHGVDVAAIVMGWAPEPTISKRAQASPWTSPLFGRRYITPQ